MKNEAEFKRVFKASVRKHGGFSLSMSAPMISGIPDLYVIMPGYLPVLLEAKWMGEIHRDTFKRKIEYTPLQMEWLKSCHNITEYSAMGLIGFKYKKQKWCFLVPSYYDYMSNETFNNGVSYVALMEKHFNIPDLFSGSKIPLLCPTTFYQTGLQTQTQLP